MHTTVIEHDGAEWRLHHDGDLGGNVIINKEPQDASFIIPQFVLLEFVGRRLQDEHIGKVEVASGVEFLGIA